MYTDLHADVTRACWLMLDVLRKPRSAPPPPAMTSPARASTWISKACLEAPMWRHTPARLRNTGTACSLSRKGGLLLCS